NTASFLFQDGYSGRAEIGLSGDDGLHFKTSPDGSTWRESLRTDPATGAVLFPSGAVSASPVVDNPVVNSTFELWMAGTTFSVAANAYGVRIADGWVANNGPSGVAATVSQAPAPVGMPGRLACNLSATGVAQNGFLDVCQRFEGQRVAHLDSVAGTVSFWVAGATTGGTLAGSVYLLGNGALDNGTYSVGLVGGGIAFVVPAVAGRVTVPLTAAQTAGLKLGAELYVRITQTGAAGNPNVTFGACQWDLGPVAQPFVPRPIEREIPLCQRYYQAGASALYRAAAVASLNGGMTAFALPTPMRAAPTVTTAVTSGPTAVPAVSASPTALRFWWGATGVAGDVQTFNYTLDARL
ncbi:MAG: hypothetical protein KGQ28_11265, partial [Hyphomicrobiales bacterium]|nr:hypothetical protein [Hyphomicrobiales bacterium]